MISELSGMSVEGFTDYPASRQQSEDSDYLSWGWWVYIKYDANQQSPELDLSLGAFADGEETAFMNLPLSGTASYSGYSSGTAIKGGAQLSPEDYSKNRVDFISEMNLTADFSNANTSISGTVDNFKGLNWKLASPDIIKEALDDGGFFEDLTVTLDHATIEERASHSFFQDTTSATDLAGAEGKWGEQFFGMPSAGEAPPAVGGTWGVTQGENGWKMLGGTARGRTLELERGVNDVDRSVVRPGASDRIDRTSAAIPSTSILALREARELGRTASAPGKANRAP